MGTHPIFESDFDCLTDKMSVAELLYFPMHGRGLIIKLAFKIGKVEFKDTILTFPEFGPMKPTLPLGQLPVLKVDDKMMCQTKAIVRYTIAKGEYEKLSPVEALTSDMVDETTQEMFEALVKAAFGAIKDITDQAEKSKKFYEIAHATMTEQLKKLEKVLAHLECKDSVVAGKICLGDLAILNMYVMCCDSKANLEDEFKTVSPAALQIVENLMKDDRIAAIINDAKKIP